jgi:hypothetical protein
MTDYVICLTSLLVVNCSGTATSGPLQEMFVLEHPKTNIYKRQMKKKKVSKTYNEGGM